MLIFNDTEEKAVEKAIAALADMIPLEAMQPPHSPVLTFEGTEKHTIFILTLIKKKKFIRVFMILVDFLLGEI